VTLNAWRRVHRAATGTLAVISILHCSLTFSIYAGWTPDSVWFFGTGLGLLFLAVVNWAHVGLGPCDLPTAVVVRWGNWVFAVFGVTAVLAVPEPQAYVILALLVIQAVASMNTLRPGPDDSVELD
jgi:hypothetical protein